MFQINHSVWIDSVIWIKLMMQIAFGVICIYLLYLQVDQLHRFWLQHLQGYQSQHGRFNYLMEVPQTFIFLRTSTSHLCSKLWSLDFMALIAFLTFPSLQILNLWTARVWMCGKQNSALEKPFCMFSLFVSQNNLLIGRDRGGGEIYYFT